MIYSSQHFNIYIYIGNVVLENLALKTDSLKALDLPLTVLVGFLDKLRVTIPWSKLKSEPVKIEIENLVLLAGPKSETNSTPESEEVKR